MSEERDTDGEEDDEPFGDLLEEIDRKRLGEQPDQTDALDDGGKTDGELDHGPAESGTGVEEIFTEEAFEEFETDELWAEIAATDPPADGVGSHVATDATVVEEAETHVVPKRTFCETCPHLGEPPEVHCTHDGTEIVSFEDMDHVRVRDCPIVDDRRD